MTKKAKRLTKQDFDTTWRELEGGGWCDGLGHSEYFRVIKEWRDANRPANMRQFIKESANRLPPDILRRMTPEMKKERERFIREGN